MGSDDEGSLYDPEENQPPAKATRSARRKRSTRPLTIGDESDPSVALAPQVYESVYDSDNTFAQQGEQTALNGKDPACVPELQTEKEDAPPPQTETELE
jgi:hypothetical protein